MHKPSLLHPVKAALVACALLLAACSPKYDWRVIRSNPVPFSIAMPAKPTTHTRVINLEGTEVSMTMTGAEVDDISFVVGTIELPDVAQAQKALAAMKTAMVRNIGGTVKKEAALPPGAAPIMVELEAAGPSHQLLARFAVKDRRVYQLIVLGRDKTIPREEADTFFTSFQPA